MSTIDSLHQAGRGGDRALAAILGIAALRQPRQKIWLEELLALEHEGAGDAEPGV